MRFSVCRQALVYDIGMSKPPRKKAGTKPGKKAPAWLPQPAPPLKSQRRGKVAADPPAGRRAAHPGRVPDPHAQREAMRDERPIASREAIVAVLADDPMRADQLAEQLELSAPDRFEALTRRLAAMVRDGQVLMNRRGRKSTRLNSRQ